MGTTNKPHRHRQKPIRIVIGTAAVVCVGFTLLYSQREQSSFKRGALYTPGTVVVTAIDGVPSPSSLHVPPSEAALPSATSPSMSAFSSDLSVAQEEAAGILATKEDLGVGDVGSLPAGVEVSAVKALPLNPLADQRREVLDIETVEETIGADFDEDKIEPKQEGYRGKQQQNEEEESGDVMEEGWEEGAEGDDDNDDDDFLFGELGEEEEEEDDDETEEEIEEEEEEENNLMEQDDAPASKGESSKLSRDQSVTATTTEEEEESADPLLAECQTSYGDRRFLREHEKALPPILYSFPGNLMFDLYTNASFIH